MKWIHEQPDWPRFRWDEKVINQKLIKLRHEQGRLLGRMESLGFSLQTEASLNMLTDDAVKSSAIEGEQLDREEVRSSIAEKLGMDSGNHPVPSRHADGIVEVLFDATHNYHEPLTAERLCAWHEALFPRGYSGLTPIVVGTWRPPSAGAMQVISGPYGKRRVHFEAPEANRLPAEMQAFIHGFENESDIDPVLKAGIAHFWFVTVHPFEDGNGRIARAIADMALSRADQNQQRFYSMSSQIEAERKDYYKQLERAQRGTLDITNWLDWFLGCLQRAIEKAGESLSAVLHKARIWERLSPHPLNQRQRPVLNRMLTNVEGYMNTSKYARMTNCSNDTALRDINALVKWGVLVKNPARGRSTSYRLVSASELQQ